MGDQLVLDVNRLVKPVSVEKIKRNEEMVGLSSYTNSCIWALDDEEAPLITTTECHICQDEDSVDILETPYSCNGSLKYAHRKCVQHWCNEKGDITCEICQISGTPMDLNDPRLLAIAEAECQFHELTHVYLLAFRYTINYYVVLKGRHGRNQTSM